MIATTKTVKETVQEIDIKVSSRACKLHLRLSGHGRRFVLHLYN